MKKSSFVRLITPSAPKSVNFWVDGYVNWIVY